VCTMLDDAHTPHLRHILCFLVGYLAGTGDLVSILLGG
jgi:hypothetical protein